MGAIEGVVIGVPTFRRPQQLAALLDSLAAEARPLQARIVVADNACDPAVGRLVAARAEAAGVDMSWHPAPEPGISHARNVLVRAATKEQPDWRWLVMYDDDGIIHPGCVAKLVAGVTRCGGDMGGGPVLLHTDGGPVLARAYESASQHRMATGPQPMLHGAQNSIYGRSIMDAVGDPWFDPALATAGGEDFELFVRAREAGAVLVWVDEAEISEPMSADRARASAVLYRAFRENATGGRIALDRGDRETVWASAGLSARMALTHLLGGLRRADRMRLAASVLDLAALSGYLSSLVGFRSEAYAHAPQASAAR